MIGESKHNLFFIEILHKLMTSVRDDDLSHKYVNQIQRQTNVLVKQMKSNDKSGDLLWNIAVAMFSLLTYQQYNYQGYQHLIMVPIYLFWYIFLIYVAWLNNQVRIAKEIH